jgi:hypothetical protein
MSDGLWLLGAWAIVQIARTLPGIVWSIRCPRDSKNYVFPAAPSVEKWPPSHSHEGR